MFTKILFITQLIIGIYSKRMIINNGNYLKATKIDQIVENIIQQFSDYNFIIHYNNQTLQDLNQIFRHLHDLNRNYYLINYDDKMIRERPIGYDVANLILLPNPYDFQRFCSIEYNLRLKDIVIFILEDYQINYYNNQIGLIDFWQIYGLRWASSILIFLTEPNRLYHCCYYCGNKTGILQPISVAKQPPNLRQFLNLYHDFNGHQFKIAYAEYPPYFWCKNMSNKCDPQGPEGIILKFLSEKFNFQYELVKYVSELSPRGQWTAMIEGVHFRRVDWAIGGVSVTMDRSISADFTRSVKTQGYSILYATYKPFWQTLKNISVIKLTVQIILFLIIISIVSCVKFGTRLFKINETIATILRITIGPVSEQSVSVNRLKLFRLQSMRSFFAFWWLIMLVLTTMYKTKLISRLISPKPAEPEKIDDLVMNDFQFHIHNDDWSVLKENLILSYDPVYRTVLERINDKFEFCDSIRESLNRPVAIIGEELAIQHSFLHDCRKYLTQEEVSRIRLVREDLFPNAYQAWCMQMGTPFVKALSDQIMRMHDYGLINYWYKSAYSFQLPRSNQYVENGNRILTIKEIWPAFLVLILGEIISIGVFLYEFCFYRNCIRFRHDFN